MRFSVNQVRRHESAKPHGNDMQSLVFSKAHTTLCARLSPGCLLLSVCFTHFGSLSIYNLAMQEVL